MAEIETRSLRYFVTLPTDALAMIDRVRGA
jgi:hypothetical protein